MGTAHTFCYKVGSAQNIASASVFTLPKSTMNCPDSSNWDKLNAFCMSVVLKQQRKYTNIISHPCNLIVKTDHNTASAFFLFRSTRGMEQVEHPEQDSSTISRDSRRYAGFRLTILFHLFRTFHSFH